MLQPFRAVQLQKTKTMRMSMASMRSVASRESDGGLSWAGSFVGPIDDEDFLDEERQDRMSSAMMPGSGKFEKGKWVSGCTHQMGAHPATNDEPDPCFPGTEIRSSQREKFCGTTAVSADILSVRMSALPSSLLRER